MSAATRSTAARTRSSQKPAAIELCRELGLADRLRPQLHRATFVVRNGRLRELPAASVLGIPTRWLPFVTTRAFSWRGKLRMGAELFVRRAVAGEDESIASFIGRRFGREAVDYLAEPLLAGIHGGHPAQLSMHTAFPRLLELGSDTAAIAGLRAMALRKRAGRLCRGRSSRCRADARTDRRRCGACRPRRFTRMPESKR
jgi:oxygen-dependent protoporphyrinogen oxidase